MGIRPRLVLHPPWPVLHSSTSGAGTNFSFIGTHLYWQQLLTRVAHWPFAHCGIASGHIILHVNFSESLHHPTGPLAGPPPPPPPPPPVFGGTIPPLSFMPSFFSSSAIRW